MVNTILIDGIIKGFNLLAGRFNTKKITPPARMATGGRVRGSGGPTADKVPTMLSPGEFVINAGPPGTTSDSSTPSTGRGSG